MPVKKVPGSPRAQSCFTSSLIDWLTDCVNGTKGGWFRCHSLQHHIWEQVGSQMSNVFYASATEPFKSSWLELVERVPQLEARTKQWQSPNKTQLLAGCMRGDVCVLKCPPDHKPFDISSQFRCSRHFVFHGSQVRLIHACYLEVTVLFPIGFTPSVSS